MPDGVPLLAATGLSRTYGRGSSAVHALIDVSLSFDEPGLYALVGRSGSGKSTLLQLLAGLDRPTAGSVSFRGTSLYELRAGELARLRATAFGFIFQRFNLVPTLTARDNILLPSRLTGAPIDTATVAKLRDGLELDDVLLSRRPAQLSGGQQQRVAIARAIVHGPVVIFADEPTGSVDAEASRAVFALLRRAVDKQGATVVMVTHDEDLATQADRCIQIVNGRFVDSAPTLGERTPAAAERLQAPTTRRHAPRASPARGQ